MNQKKLIKNSIFYLCILGFLVGLAAFAYMGLNMRLSGDDYCEAAIVTKHGFFNAQLKAYFDEVPFHGNRYTKTFIATFFSLFPPKINGYLPIIVIIISVLGIAVLQHSINKILLQDRTLLSILLFSVAGTFFTLLMSPTVNQSLYWKSAMLPSTAPIFGTLFLIAFILTRKEVKWYELAGLFLFSLINGGLSENGVMFQVFSIGISLTIVSLFYKNPFKKPIISNGLVAVFGSFCAVIIMWLSPSILQERSEMALSFSRTIFLSIENTLKFYLGVVRSYLFGVFALIVLGMLIELLDFQFADTQNTGKKSNFKHWLIIILIIQIIVLILIHANMLPSAFTRNAFPDPRHLIMATFVSVIGFLSTGMAIGKLLSLIMQKLQPGFGRSIYSILAVGLAMLIITGMYPIRYFPHVVKEEKKFQYWAYQWDQRDKNIRLKIASGANEIHVMNLDSIIEGVGELSPDPEYWYNLCAADYYAVSKIYADLPGWDEEWSDFMK